MVFFVFKYDEQSTNMFLICVRINMEHKFWFSNNIHVAKISLALDSRTLDELRITSLYTDYAWSCNRNDVIHRMPEKREFYVHVYYLYHVAIIKVLLGIEKNSKDQNA